MMNELRRHVQKQQQNRKALTKREVKRIFDAELKLQSFDFDLIYRNKDIKKKYDQLISNLYNLLKDHSFSNVDKRGIITGHVFNFLTLVKKFLKKNIEKQVVEMNNVNNMLNQHNMHNREHEHSLKRKKGKRKGKKNSSWIKRRMPEDNNNNFGGNQYVNVPNYGRRKVRYQKNGRAFVLVNKKKMFL